jgi:protein-disulfide isomerase
MTIAERIAKCRLIEKIEKNEAYAKKLGISNVSSFFVRSKTYYGIKK